MSDTLSALMREMIAAFPEERVQRIPRGVSGEPAYTYVPGSGAAGGLVSKGPTAKERVRQSHRVRIRGEKFRALKRREERGEEPVEKAPKLVMVRAPKPRPEPRPDPRSVAKAERHRIVRTLIEAGATQVAISEATGVNKRTIRADVADMRRAGTLPAFVRATKPERPRKADIFAAVAERRERIRVAYNAGTGIAAIAEAEGISSRTVDADLILLRKAGAIGIRPWHSEGRTRGVSPGKAQRQARVAEMLAAGMSQSAISLELGVSHATISMDARAIRGA